MFSCLSLRRLRVAALLLLLSGSSFAQVRWENQVWTSVQLQKKIIPKTRAELTLESRWNIDPLMAVRYFPNLGIQRKWSDNFSTVLHYRYITSNRGLGVRESSHRLMLDAIGSMKIKKYDFALRFRAGREDEPGNAEGIVSLSEMVLRQKLTVKKKFFKQEFSFSVEQFETLRAGVADFDQRRFVLGMESKLNKQHFLDFFVMYQDLVDTRRMNFGVGYIYKFKD
ncbi:MAG: DUF2490 domain-containing protein [Bacteroidia bacterium]|nr:DUF2490 domain-containing protein [Bacteroidia bacterium]